jgi:hypothetical protein
MQAKATLGKAQGESPQTSADGIVEWRDREGRLDRADGPARIHPEGREE